MESLQQTAGSLQQSAYSLQLACALACFSKMLKGLLEK